MVDGVSISWRDAPTVLTIFRWCLDHEAHLTRRRTRDGIRKRVMITCNVNVAQMLEKDGVTIRMSVRKLNGFATTAIAIGSLQQM